MLFYHIRSRERQKYEPVLHGEVVFARALDGSLRFSDAFNEIEAEMTENGKIVE